MELGQILNIRNALNKNSIVTSIVLIVVIITLLIYGAYYMGYLGSGGGHTQASSKVFYFDEENGNIEIRSATELPPLAGRSGNPTLVRAHFFTTSTDSAKKLMYVERYTPEGKAALEATGTGQPLSNAGMEALRSGPQVRAPEPNSPWYFQNTPEGQAIINSFATLDPDASKIRVVVPR